MSERETRPATADGAAAPEAAARALATRPVTAIATGTTEPAPPLRIARSLEEAGRGTFVHIDARGEVRSPGRYQAMTAVGYGLTAGLVVAATVFYVGVFGPLGAIAGVLFGSAFLVGHRRGRRLTRAATLIQADRLDEAEALCRQVLRGRAVPRRLRAVAHQNLSAVAARRGEFETSLRELRQAIKLRHSAFRRNVYIDVLAYVEIALLVNLGRPAEARARLDGRGRPPEGNYLRVQHWTADLYVQFAEGRLLIDEEELWQRSQAALKITGAAQLLGLCAWGFAQLGDQDMESHLIEQAIDRAEPSLPVRVPGLWKWLEGRRVAPATE